MILADDNFATIVAAVREGRGIFANIRKFLRFLLSSNIGEVLTMFLGVVLAGVIGLDDTGEAIAVPLLATQILWINLLTDTAPALAMGVDPPPRRRHGSDRRARLSDRVIDGEMWIGIVWVGLVMAVVTLLAARPPPRRRAARAGRARSTRRARWRSRRSSSPSSSTASTPAPIASSAFHHLFTNRWLWARDRAVGRPPGRGRRSCRSSTRRSARRRSASRTGWSASGSRASCCGPTRRRSCSQR